MSNSLQQVSAADAWLSPYDMAGAEAGGGGDFDPDRFKRVLTESGYKNNPIGNLIADLCKVTGLEPKAIQSYIRKYQGQASSYFGAAYPFVYLSGYTNLEYHNSVLFPSPEAYVIWRRVNGRRHHNGLSPIKFDQLFGHVPTDSERVSKRKQYAHHTTYTQQARFYVLEVAGRLVYERFLRQMDQPQNRTKILLNQCVPRTFGKINQFFGVFIKPSALYRFEKNDEKSKLTAHPSENFRALCAHLGCRPQDLLPVQEGLLLHRVESSNRAVESQMENMAAFLTYIGMSWLDEFKVHACRLSGATMSPDQADGADTDFKAVALQIVRICRQDNVKHGMMDNIALTPDSIPAEYQEMIDYAKAAAGLPEDSPNTVVTDVWRAYAADKTNRKIIDALIDGEPVETTAIANGIGTEQVKWRRRNVLADMVHALRTAISRPAP